MKVDRTMIVEALTELSDSVYQERVWSGNDPSLMSSLTECMEQLFDDSGLKQALERGPVFGAQLDDRLLTLEFQLNMVDASQPVPALLQDVRLARIRRLAAEILSDLSFPAPQSD